MNLVPSWRFKQPIFLHTTFVLYNVDPLDLICVCIPDTFTQAHALEKSIDVQLTGKTRCETKAWVKSVAFEQ